MAKTRAQRKAERRAREAEERKRSDGEREAVAHAQHDTQVPISGDEALNLLRSTGSEIPFIFVSGHIGEDRAVAALQAGAQNYVMKNNLKRLIPAVERELREVEQRRERRSLERQVKHLEKFEAVGRLAAGIAHDHLPDLRGLLEP